MPDLLHRLAARTLGHAPTLTPRIPSDYEPGVGPSIVDVEVSAAPSAPHGARTSVAAQESQRPWDVDGPGAQGERVVVAGPAAPSQSPQPARRAAAAAFVPGGPAEHDSPAPLQMPPAAVAPVVPRVEVVGVVATRPPLPERHAPAMTRGTQASPPRPDVHITIGRIEVRAEAPAAHIAQNAPAAPPPAARREPAEPAVLTLSAYLRGDDGRPR
jgi:hypothetical protein